LEQLQAKLDKAQARIEEQETYLRDATHQMVQTAYDDGFRKQVQTDPRYVEYAERHAIARPAPTAPSPTLGEEEADPTAARFGQLEQDLKQVRGMLEEQRGQRIVDGAKEHVTKVPASPAAQQKLLRIGMALTAQGLYANPGEAIDALVGLGQEVGSGQPNIPPEATGAAPPTALPNPMPPGRASAPPPAQALGSMHTREGLAERKEATRQHLEARAAREQP
jgi:hypothetical protein